MVHGVYTQGKGGALTVLLTQSCEEALAESVLNQVSADLPGMDMAVAVYEVSDWDGALSPWEYCLPEGRYFAGHGRATLEDIQRYCGELTGYKRVYIAGYSLAGLFALWAVHETELFDGCACCSGSLWFGGWEEYSKTHGLKKPGTVYLSLGGKEEKPAARSLPQ